MSIAHLLEDFELSPNGPGRLHLLSEDALEEQRLASFEQGYSAGWDDAIAAQSENQARLSAGLSKSLEDLSFSYNEALGQMNRSLEPMFTGLVETVLPEALEQSYGHHIVEQLQEMAREQISQPVLLVLPAGVGRALEPVLDRDFGVPIQMVEDGSLSPGQACLRVGTAEREVDCSELLESISAAVSAFTHAGKESVEHGQV